MTTSVLEHIPPEQIARILREAHRILPPGGAIMSHVIDYSDHYAHSDARITPYHYLSFEEPTWRRFNPGIHYQNRLRHVDYRPLFESAVVPDRVGRVRATRQRGRIAVAREGFGQLRAPLSEPSSPPWWAITSSNASDRPGRGILNRKARFDASGATSR